MQRLDPGAGRRQKSHRRGGVNASRWQNLNWLVLATSARLRHQIEAAAGGCEILQPGSVQMTDFTRQQSTPWAITGHRVALIALVLNLFAIGVVNFWIYYARATFIRIATYYKEPPTISRAISEPVIGEPFAFWVPFCGLLLIVGVTILVARLMAQIKTLPAPSRYLRICAFILLPVLALMQACSAIGMYGLSVYRFPNAHEMHMAGSYLFFLSQLLVIIIYTVFNHAVLRDRSSLAKLHDAGHLDGRAVKLRFLIGWACIGIVLTYFTLFVLKDVYPYLSWPALHLWYTLFELAVISSFLFLLALAHLDLFKRPTIA